VYLEFKWFINLGVRREGKTHTRDLQWLADFTEAFWRWLCCLHMPS